MKENGQYKLLDSSDKPNAIALEMLDRIKAGNLNGAKVLLDWIREDQHLGGGDDTLGGPVFPRFWIKGEAADAHKMTLAAACADGGYEANSRPGSRDCWKTRARLLQQIARRRTSSLRWPMGYSQLEEYREIAGGRLGPGEGGSGINAPLS